MHKKLITACLALVAFAAMAVVPAMASAAPTVDTSTGKTVSFTGTSGTTVLRDSTGLSVTCTSDHNSGTFAPGSTGTVTIKFTGCSSSGGPCTTAGQASGVITTGESVTHLVYLDAAHTTVGVLITPPTGGTFATFDCNVPLIGTVHITVAGNGIIGHFKTCSTEANKAFSTFSVGFTASGSTQTYRQVEGAGTIFSLTSNGNTASEEGTESGTISGGATATLTCL